MHSLAEAYGKRPSEIVGLETAWGAFQFDEVCLMVGRRVEKNLNEGKDAFAGFSSINKRAVVGSQRYRSAAGPKARRMKIPANGIW